MPTQIFAKLGDIKGESLDAKHKDSIEVLSFSWGVSHAVGSISGGAAAGKPAFQDLSFTHGIDSASPALLRACALGEHLKQATITHRKAGKGQQEFLIVKMQDVVITAVAHGGTPDLTTENVSLTCAKVALEYRRQKPDGSLDTPVAFTFDLAAHKTF